MQITFIQYLIVCPLMCVAGFVDSIAGGGGLISLPAYLIAGFPTHYALGTNKLSSGMGTALAAYRYAKNKYVEDWRQAICCAVFALIGSATGVKLALLIEDGIFKIVMLVILPLTAIYIMRPKTFSDSNKKPFTIKKTILISMAIALVVGIYDGFYGPGAGSFLILAMTSIARMKLSSANGVAKVINLTTDFTSVVVYFINGGKVSFFIGIVGGLFCFGGSYIGTKFFDKKGAKSVKPIMIVVLVIFFVKVLLEVLGIELF